MNAFEYLTNFKFTSKEHESEEIVAGEYFKQKVVSIGVYIINMDITIPHPLTYLAP